MKRKCCLVILIICLIASVTSASNSTEAMPLPSGIYFIQDKNTVAGEAFPSLHSGTVTAKLRYHSVAIPALILMISGYPDGALIYTTTLLTMIVGHKTGLSFWLTALATEQTQLGLELEVNRYYHFTDFNTLDVRALSSELQPWSVNARYHFNLMKAKYDDSHRHPPVTLLELLQDHYPLLYPNSGSALLAILQTYLLNRGPVQSIIVISAQALTNLAVHSVNGQYLENQMQLFKYDDSSSTFHPVNWPWHLQAFLLRSYIILAYTALSGGTLLVEGWLKIRLAKKMTYFSQGFPPH